MVCCFFNSCSRIKTVFLEYKKLTVKLTIRNIPIKYTILLVVYLPEIISIPCVQWLYGDAALVEVDGVHMLRWETYVFTLIIRVFVLIGIYMLVRDWRNPPVSPAQACVSAD